MTSNPFTRKKFIALASVGLVGSFAPVMAQQDKPPALDKDLVRDFIGAGHKDLEKVKKMLVEHPALLYATWDHGGGDFETALEGAGHVGNKEIAYYLIEQGARINLFALTMLGKTNIVKPFLEEFPQFIKAKGPHGFTLLHHAQRGGDDAKELLEFLTAKGLKETKISIS
jgi:hypothetical protein